MRLIDADKLDFSSCDSAFECFEAVECAETISAVPVVRCRECKHYRIHHVAWGEDIPHCIKAWGGAEVDPMDFCAYGERKDGE